MVEFVGDDSFDQDQGYTGVNQFLFSVQTFFNENDGGAFGTDGGDKACELDGDDFNEPSVEREPGRVRSRSWWPPTVRPGRSRTRSCRT